MKLLHKQKGLTQIEKLVGYAFAGIIVLVTIPAVIAFTGRPQVIESHTLMRPVHDQVNAYLQQYGRCPQGGIAALGVEKTSGKYVANISLDDQCVIRATYRADAREKIAGKTLAWYAGADAQGNIHWACGTAAKPDLGPNPRIAFAAGPEDTTADYAPWLPTKCHPPRALDERKPALLVWLQKGSFDQG